MKKNEVADMSRTTQTIKNSMFSILSIGTTIILGFVSRTVFISLLGKSYLGINGLFTEVISVLSFAELGFGTSMSYALYSPVSKGDSEKIRMLLQLFKKVYLVIAIVVALAGLAILPWLQYIVKGADGISLGQLRFYFILFLTNTVVGYFVVYKTAYVHAMMKNYVVTNIQTIMNIIIILGQLLVLYITNDYSLYLLTNTFLLIASRFIISVYLNRKYPILKEKPKNKLPREDRNNIFHEVKGLSVHHFASIAIHSTDSIITSMFSGMGVIAVGLVSNYNLIINYVVKFANVFFKESTSAFGNLVAASSTVNYRRVFAEANFICFWIYGFCCVGFYVLIPPFITLWIGEDFLIDNATFALIVFDNFFLGFANLYNHARVAKGDFNRDKWVSIIQALINLVVSILAAMKYGLFGVYIGTVVSRVFAMIAKPCVTYKFLFEESVKEYFKQLLKYTTITILAVLLTKLSASLILQECTIPHFAVAMIIVLIVPNLIFFILFSKTKEFLAMKRRCMQIIDFRRKKKNV